MSRSLIAALPARKNRHLNPFQYLLYEALDARGYETVEFERALFQAKPVRIVHLHWPDGAVLHRSAIKTLVRMAVFFGLLKFYSLNHTRVVWTAHNLGSHDQYHPRLEQYFWARLYPQLDAVISMKPLGQTKTLTGNPALAGKPVVHIAHGEYATYYREAAAPDYQSVSRQRPQRSPMRFLVFGHVRPYKQVPAILNAFSQYSAPSASLKIVGRCLDAELSRSLSEKAGADPRVTFCNQLVLDEAVASVFDACDAILISKSSEKNSGVLHLAASFGVPVVFVDGEATDWERPIILEVPPTWPELAAQHDRLFSQLLSNIK